jgi:hypothetical protein
MIKCKDCGFDLTGIGILGYIEHMEKHTEPLTIKSLTKKEIKEIFMNVSFSNTKIEKKSYEDNLSY